MSRDNASDQLENFKQSVGEGGIEKLTTGHGAPIGDKQNSLTVGHRGPVLIQVLIIVFIVHAKEFR